MQKTRRALSDGNPSEGIGKWWKPDHRSTHRRATPEHRSVCAVAWRLQFRTGQKYRVEAGLFIRSRDTRWQCLLNQNIRRQTWVGPMKIICWPIAHGRSLPSYGNGGFRGYEVSHKPADFNVMTRKAREIFPAAADYSKPEYWAGLRPMTPSGLPIVSASPIDNLWLNTGHGIWDGPWAAAPPGFWPTWWSVGNQRSTLRRWLPSLLMKEKTLWPTNKTPLGATAANINHIPFETDAGVAHRAAIGLIVLSTDQTIEHEFASYSNRKASPTTKAVFQILTGSRRKRWRKWKIWSRTQTDVILPGLPIDVVAFGCTSASMVIGEEMVFTKIRENGLMSPARPRSLPLLPLSTP